MVSKLTFYFKKGDILTSKTFSGRSQKQIKQSAFKHYLKIGAEGFSHVYPVKGEAKKIRQQLSGKEFESYTKELSKQRTKRKQQRSKIVKPSKPIKKETKPKPKSKKKKWIPPKAKKSTKEKPIPISKGNKRIQIDMAFIEIECYDIEKYGEILFTHTIRLYSPITLTVKSVWKDIQYISNRIFNRMLSFHKNQFKQHTPIRAWNLSFYFKDLDQEKTYKYSRNKIRRYYYD